MRLRRRAAAAPLAPERTVPLQARAVAGNLVAAADGVWAWYRLSDTPYWFTDVAFRRHQRSAVMARFADLVGHRVQFRVTEHPVAAARLGRRLPCADGSARTAPPRRPGRSPGTTSST